MAKIKTPSLWWPKNNNFRSHFIPKKLFIVLSGRNDWALLGRYSKHEMCLVTKLNSEPFPRLCRETVRQNRDMFRTLPCTASQLDTFLRANVFRQEYLSLLIWIRKCVNLRWFPGLVWTCSFRWKIRWQLVEFSHPNEMICMTGRKKRKNSSLRTRVETAEYCTSFAMCWRLSA